MEFVWAILAIFVIILVLVTVISGGVFLFLKLRAHEPINVNLRYLVRIYLLVVTVAGLLVITQGASDLLRAGFASAGSNQFSYDPVWVRLASDDAPQPRSPLEIKDRQQLTDEELDELVTFQNEQQELRTEQEAERRRLGLERAKDEGLIQGFSFLFIGVLIWGSHFAGRRWLESDEEKGSLLNRIYLVLITVVFGIITIVLLPQAVFETFRYVVLDPVDAFNTDQPGQKLALSITTLPIWLLYLYAVIRTMRRTAV
ncbi:MAG: hypothetical protein HOC77_00445 [Chloroflexi bacterium]|jgi:hypothetical protein|nr:hypothetical protein [Chloroflexota bacterium]MBT4073958.1 hypothetical protein [Chloroflexota bacterium]MBT4513544.1 hypothetical protein [Chloroflexota bacterium]MBT6680714.1 hypothetical protein [Chloroflexota bacterium]